MIGEWLAADAPQHYVLRVESLFGGPHRRSSVDRIVDAVRSGQPAPVFVDRVVSPSFVADVADASAFMLRTRPAAGLYHCVNSGHATWLAVGQEIVRRLGAIGRVAEADLGERREAARAAAAVCRAQQRKTGDGRVRDADLAGRDRRYLLRHHPVAVKMGDRHRR